MENLITERLILRKFETTDWKDVLEISIDWKKAPGPEWDKWPITEEECKGFVNYLVDHDNFFAVYLSNENNWINCLKWNK